MCVLWEEYGSWSGCRHTLSSHKGMLILYSYLFVYVRFIYEIISNPGYIQKIQEYEIKSIEMVDNQLTVF